MAISTKWMMTKSGYYADFFIAPIFMIISTIIGGFNPLLIIAGVTIWTFLEYWIHRYLFHNFFRNDHWLHHIHDKDYIGVPWWKISLIFISVAIIMYFIGFNSLFTGLVLGYFMYIIFHDAIHHENFLTPYIWTKNAHEYHHTSGEEVNFGLTTSFWDKVFRTYK